MENNVCGKVDWFDDVISDAVPVNNCDRYDMKATKMEATASQGMFIFSIYGAQR